MAAALTHSPASWYGSELAYLQTGPSDAAAAATPNIPGRPDGEVSCAVAATTLARSLARRALVEAGSSRRYCTSTSRVGRYLRGGMYRALPTQGSSVSAHWLEAVWRQWGYYMYYIKVVHVVVQWGYYYKQFVGS